MTTSPTNLTDLAKQGNPDAIAALMNRLLQPKGITASVEAAGDRLYIRLEADQTPAQSALVKFVQGGLTNLGLSSVQSAQLSAYQTGEPTPVWEEFLDLQPPASDAAEPVESAADAAAAAPAPDDAPAEEEAPPPIESPTTAFEKKLRLIGIAILAALFGAGGLAYALLRQPQTPPPAPVNTVPLSPPPATADGEAAFRDAVNKAMQAANLTQTAATTAEWQQIVALWQDSIDRLEQIPGGDPNHAIAQQKIGEYQRNLSYAQQQANNAE